MEKIIAFSRFMGVPTILAFVGNSWWIMEKDEYLTEVESSDLGEDYYYLCKLGETKLVCDLALMMGCAIEDVPLYKVKDTLKARFRLVNELGVKFLAEKQTLNLLVKVQKNEDPYMDNKITVSCKRMDDDRTLFEINDCVDAEMAFLYAKYYVEFFMKHGVKVSSVLECQSELLDRFADDLPKGMKLECSY